MSKITNAEVNYIDVMATKLVDALREFNSEYDAERYVYSSSARARFDRLRVELNKELMRVRRKIYAN